jgi:hypothetical protein
MRAKLNRVRSEKASGKFLLLREQVSPIHPGILDARSLRSKDLRAWRSVAEPSANVRCSKAVLIWLKSLPLFVVDTIRDAAANATQLLWRRGRRGAKNSGDERKGRDQ